MPTINETLGVVPVSVVNANSETNGMKVNETLGIIPVSVVPKNSEGGSGEANVAFVQYVTEPPAAGTDNSIISIMLEG